MDMELVNALREVMKPMEDRLSSIETDLAAVKTKIEDIEQKLDKKIIHCLRQLLEIHYYAENRDVIKLQDDIELLKGNQKILRACIFDSKAPALEE